MDEVIQHNAAVRAALLALVDEADGDLRVDLERMVTACGELADLVDQLPASLIDADADRLRELRHDVRSPVGQIVGYCELLAEEAQDDGREDWGREARDGQAGGGEAAPRGRGARRRPVAAFVDAGAQPQRIPSGAGEGHRPRD